MKCAVRGIGAWGPGFNTWQDLTALIKTGKGIGDKQSTGPKPAIIPANERRRAPLSVRLAVDAAWQALQQADIDSDQMSCVFCCGLGDTDITDYMCRALNKEPIVISPTKFHNSVHNAAAGYWTISTGCMGAASSTAGFDLSVSLNLMEGVCQCVTESTSVVMSFFDAPASDVHEQIMKSPYPFAASIVISDEIRDGDIAMAVSIDTHPCEWQTLKSTSLQSLYDTNPTARFLGILEALSGTLGNKPTLQLPLSPGTSLNVELLL